MLRVTRAATGPDRRWRLPAVLTVCGLALAVFSFRLISQEPLSALADTEATLTRYCITCHNDRLQTAGLILDPAGLARVGERIEVWEKVLRQLRSGTMAPPGAPRPQPEAYTRASAYLIRELENTAAAHPNAGVLPSAHRLTRTEYRNAIRDLLALRDLPKEMDYSTLLPADNANSGFDNLADTLFVSPAAMERYLAAARKISRIAVGDQGPGRSGEHSYHSGTATSGGAQ
jgi:hypothetical protein